MPQTKRSNRYKTCDFCHKIKPVEEIEEISIVYRKCSGCKEIIVKEIKVEEKGDIIGISSKVKEVIPFTPRKKSIPPPSIGSAFQPDGDISFIPSPVIPQPLNEKPKI